MSAFYTNLTVIKAMYEALDNIGVTSQIRENDKLNILEPSLGVGNFFGVMPEELQQKSNLHGIELDSISARIAQNLYPQADIQNTGYEETYAKDYFDVILGNVPFGDFRLIDKQNPEIAHHGFHIHGHFFAKALDQVWAREMACLLLRIKAHVDMSKLFGANYLEQEDIDIYAKSYREILKEDLLQPNSLKESKLMAKRLTEYEQETLLFMLDFDVPFTIAL